MRYYILLFAMGFLLLYCSDNGNEADRSYTFSSYDQNMQGLFLINDNDDLVEIDYSLSSRLENRELIQMEALQNFLDRFDLREIKFLNEQTVMIKYYTYGLLKQIELQISGNMITIPELIGRYLIYDSTKDQFDLCGLSIFTINGPNSILSDSSYNHYILWECENSLSESVKEFQDDHNYNELDTLDVIKNRLYYK